MRQHQTTGAICDRRGAPRRPFPRRYTNADVGLLAEVDALHGTLSGPPTRKLCARALHLFGDRRFERLAAISNGHLYNLRHATSYQRRRGAVPAPTRSAQVAIGERRRPQPFGQPGWIRVVTVHQGDLDGIKGLYHLNLVDEVTQFQCIGSVEHIHAACLKPLLDALLRAFPFTLHGFHADNGSEFINREVAALLQALHIDAFTKSRARRSTDNALVESKNGSVIRKHLGHGHIPSRCAEQLNAFTQQVRSCGPTNGPAPRGCSCAISVFQTRRWASVCTSTSVRSRSAPTVSGTSTASATGCASKRGARRAPPPVRRHRGSKTWPAASRSVNAA